MPVFAEAYVSKQRHGSAKGKKEDEEKEDSETHVGVRKLVRSPWFDNCIVFLIIINCIYLASQSPPSLQTDEEAAFCFIVDLTFTIIFIIEMCLKWYGLGIRAYFKDHWNRLDCLIVIQSLISLLPGFITLNSIRLLRMLRPLRLLQRLGPMRTLVDSLLSAIPALLDVGILVVFILTVYALLGVQLWSGKLHARCYMVNTTIVDMDGFDTDSSVSLSAAVFDYEPVFSPDSIYSDGDQVPFTPSISLSIYLYLYLYDDFIIRIVI